MEVLAAKALKPSLRREVAFMKSSTPQALCEELFSLNGTNGVSVDDFSVDDLLDFSNDEFPQNSVAIEDEIYEDESEEGKDSDSVSSQDRSEEDSNSNSTTSVSGGADSDSIFASELAVPDDDLAELEWVSRFVDDFVPEIPVLYPLHSEQTKSQTKKRPESEPRPDTAKTPCFPFQIPVKARTTKRRNPNTRVWSFNSLIPRPSPTSSVSSSSRGDLIFGSTVPDAGWTGFIEPPAKKQKKKPEAQDQNGGAQFQRRCSHCQVQKTPQWRTGPLGPKTLCNACGVRFKSGRLFPEYRPACSPTFSSEIHSNSHRKVLEMRRRKEVAGPESGLTQTQMVPSY